MSLLHVGTTKQKEIFTYSHFLKTSNKQNKTTKYVQEGKGYVDLNFFNYYGAKFNCRKNVRNKFINRLLVGKRNVIGAMGDLLGHFKVTTLKE